MLGRMYRFSFLVFAALLWGSILLSCVSGVAFAEEVQQGSAAQGTETEESGSTGGDYENGDTGGSGSGSSASGAESSGGVDAPGSSDVEGDTDELVSLLTLEVVPSGNLFDYLPSGYVDHLTDYLTMFPIGLCAGLLAYLLGLAWRSVQRLFVNV